DLARARDRANDIGGKLVGLTGQVGGQCIHGVVPLQEESRKLRTREAGAHGPRTRRGHAKLPYGGINRIRFEGCVSTGRRVWRVVPPLQPVLEHGGGGKARAEPRGSSVEPWISPDFRGDKT